jgi:hypothetical protein
MNHPGRENGAIQQGRVQLLCDEFENSGDDEKA